MRHCDNSFLQVLDGVSVLLLRLCLFCRTSDLLWVVVCTTSCLPSGAGGEGEMPLLFLWPILTVNQNSRGGGLDIGRLRVCEKLWFLLVTRMSCTSLLQTVWTVVWRWVFAFCELSWSASLLPKQCSLKTGIFEEHFWNLFWKYLFFWQEVVPLGK